MIGVEVLKFVKNISLSWKFPNSINKTWVTLIPKSKSAKSVEDYRPVSMVGCLYKIISKVMSRRLRAVIGDIIS